MSPVITKGLVDQECILFLNTVVVNVDVGYDTAWDILCTLTLGFLENKSKTPKLPHFRFCSFIRKVWILLTVVLNTESSQAPNIAVQHRPGTPFVLPDMMPALPYALKHKMKSRNETIFFLPFLSVSQACSKCNQTKLVTHTTDFCLQSSACSR